MDPARNIPFAIHLADTEIDIAEPVARDFGVLPIIRGGVEEAAQLHIATEIGGGNVELRSFFYSTADDGQYTKVPGYGLGNIDFGIRQVDGKWDISGWVHNVTNEHYYLFKEVTGSLPAYNLVVGEVGDPLTFGVTLRAKFE